MLNNKANLDYRSNLTHGVEVRSLDGEKLGKVINITDDTFTVEKGVFFPKEFTARLEDIQEIRDGVVYLSHGMDRLDPWREESYQGWSDIDRYNENEESSFKRSGDLGAGASFQESENIQVPIIEEQLEARKRMREAGNVRLRKVVHTEHRQFTVPVMREEVTIERVAVDSANRQQEASMDMKNETIDIPVREEEVEVTKRPVVKEEVRVSKTLRQEERTVEGDVRKQDVEIDREGKERKVG